MDALELQERLFKLTFYENELWRQGNILVAGIDEAGRGPLAGPVVAAAVIFPKDQINILGLDDSKKLSATKRQALEIDIKHNAFCYGIGFADHSEIDAINILQATKLAMQRAIQKLKSKPDHLLIDAVKLDALDIPQTPLIKGDSISASIAAASILAKCYRDRLMQSFDKVFPQYGFAKHKGYPTQEHYKALTLFGPSPIHRKTYRLK